MLLFGILIVLICPFVLAIVALKYDPVQSDALEAVNSSFNESRKSLRQALREQRKHTGLSREEVIGNVHNLLDALNELEQERDKAIKAIKSKRRGK